MLVSFGNILSILRLILYRSTAFQRQQYLGRRFRWQSRPVFLAGLEWWHSSAQWESTYKHVLLCAGCLHPTSYLATLSLYHFGVSKSMIPPPPYGQNKYGQRRGSRKLAFRRMPVQDLRISAISRIPPDQDQRANHKNKNRQ